MRGRCIGCGRQLHNVLSCSCGAELCSEVCLRRHQKSCSSISLASCLSTVVVLAIVVAGVGGAIFLCCGGMTCAALNVPVNGSRLATQREVAVVAPTSQSAPVTMREPPSEDPEIVKRRIEDEKAEYERREAARKADPDFGRNLVEERDAKTLLDLAKRTMNEAQRMKSLQSIIKQYPKTKAADEARKLLK